MRAPVIVGSVLAALSLAGCVAGGAVSPDVHLTSGKALIDAESALDAALVATTAAVNAGVTTKAQNAEIARLTAPCPPGVLLTTATALANCPVTGLTFLARQAYAVSDTASFPVLIANLTSLAAKLATTHP